MTREEYDALLLPEADIEFHRNPAEGETYVTVVWKIPEPGPVDEARVYTVKGFKFVVATEIIKQAGL